MERVEQFFLANNIDDDHKVPTLLSLIGGKTYALLRDLLTPEKPATKSFQEIVTTLQHLSFKPLEIAERFRFYKRNQREGETVLTYVANLKKLVGPLQFWRKTLMKPYETGWSVAFAIYRYKSICSQKPNWNIPRLWRSP